jgi:hypothetical protein
MGMRSRGVDRGYGGSCMMARRGGRGCGSTVRVESWWQSVSCIISFGGRSVASPSVQRVANSLVRR